MNILLRIIKYIAITILLVLALMFLSILIQTKKNSDKIPSIFGYKPFIILSESMESELYKGDLAIVKVVDKKR